MAGNDDSYGPEATITAFDSITARYGRRRYAHTPPDITPPLRDVEGIGLTGLSTNDQPVNDANRIPEESFFVNTDSPDFPRGEYRLGAKLGEGGMGVVYRAHHNGTNRNVAFKRIKDSGQRALAILWEAHVTARLEHPGITPVYDIGKTADGECFYTMREHSGQTWSNRIKQTSLRDNIDILMRVADTIAYAHDRLVLHLDLKPSNVMVGEFGEVSVIDWGLAVSLSSDDPGYKPLALPLSELPPYSPVGTPAYMAPEMARGQRDALGPHSDIYLLGAVLFEIVTGTYPHRTRRTGPAVLAFVADNPIAEVNPAAVRSVELLTIARKAMRSDPAERYGTVKDFQQDVRRALRRRESAELIERGTALARDAREYETFDQALEKLSAAEALRPNYGPLRGRIQRTLLDYARLALSRDELRLAETQLNAAFKNPALPVSGEAGAEGETDTEIPDAAGLQQERAVLREAIQTRRAVLEQRTAKARRMRCWVFSLTALVLLAVLAGGGFSAFAWRKSEAARTLAEQRGKENERLWYADLFRKADEDARQGRIIDVRRRLRELPVAPRGWEYQFLSSKLAGMTWHPEAIITEGRVDFVAFHPESTRFSVQSRANGSWTVVEYSLPKIEETRRWTMDHPFKELAYDPQGRLWGVQFVTTPERGPDTTIMRLGDNPMPFPPLRLVPPESARHAALGFRKDEVWLAVANDRQGLLFRVWSMTEDDIASDLSPAFFGQFRVPAYLGEQGEPQQLLRFSPDGAWLSAGVTLISAYPVPDGKTPFPMPVTATATTPPNIDGDFESEWQYHLRRHKDQPALPSLEGVAVPPDGVFSWTEPENRTIPPTPPPEGIPATPDNYIRADADRLIALVDGGIWQVAHDSDQTQTRAVAATRNAAWAAMATRRTLRVWRRQEGIESVEPVGCFETALGFSISDPVLSFSPDGRWMMAALRGKEDGLALWRMNEEQTIPIQYHFPRGTASTADHPAATNINPHVVPKTTWALDNNALRETQTGLTYFPANGGQVTAMAVPSDGATIIVLEKSGYEARVTRVHLSTGTSEVTASLSASAAELKDAMLLSPDGSRLFLLRSERLSDELLCLDAKSLKLLLCQRLGVLIREMAFDETGTRLTLAHESGWVELDGSLRAP